MPKLFSRYGLKKRQSIGVDTSRLSVVIDTRLFGPKHRVFNKHAVPRDAKTAGIERGNLERLSKWETDGKAICFKQKLAEKQINGLTRDIRV
jgi:hypothetical protein